MSNNHVGWIMFLGISLGTLLKTSDDNKNDNTSSIDTQIT